MSNEYDSLIWKAGQTHGVDPYLIKAIMWAESNFNPKAYRYEANVQDGSYGLMQTRLSTARWMGYLGEPEGLFVPQTSIEFGTRYLKKQLIRYAGNTAAAVAAYNAGTARVVNGKYSNQKYVDRVMNRYELYRQQGIAGEQEANVIFRTTSPQMGPAPSSPPVRLQAASDGDTMAASLETFLSSDYGPYILALGGGLLLVTLLGKK